MELLKIAVSFWIVLAVNGERWYSANLESNSVRPTKSTPTQNELKYMPLKMINKDNQTNKFQFLRKYTTTFPTPLAAYNKLSVLKNRTQIIQNEQDHIVERFSYNDAISVKNANATNRRSSPVIKINKTITNVNVIKKPKTHKKPKGKLVRRCPSLRPRQKKQLYSNDLNLTAQKRFLEVFEVVEFEHEVCISSSGLEGICLPEFDCQSSGGYPMGSCADGYGTCCVTKFSCEDRSAATSGWFVNPGFPSPSTDRLSCVFTLDKASSDIQQIRLDFNNFELLPPTLGTCEQDQFIVMGQNTNNMIPILCGVNSGQHVYIEVGDAEGPITFSILTISSDTRLFSIRVMQLTSTDSMAAPSGCLQYFRSSLGYLESFNFRDKSDIAIARTPSYLNNLNYAMCIERAPEACSVTYTNSGGMQIVNYDTDGLPVLPPNQAGVEIFNCPTDWLLIAAVRLCGERLNDGSVLQDFALDAPVSDISAGPIIVWFRSDGGYVGKGFKLQYQQNNC